MSISTMLRGYRLWLKEQEAFWYFFPDTGDSRLSHTHTFSLLSLSLSVCVKRKSTCALKTKTSSQSGSLANWVGIFSVQATSSNFSRGCTQRICFPRPRQIFFVLLVYSGSAQLVQALRFQCCDCRGGGGGRRNAGCHEQAPRHFAFGRLPVASNPQFPCWHSVVILGQKYLLGKSIYSFCYKQSAHMLSLTHTH